VSEMADSAICTSAYVECISINVVILLHDQHCDTHTQWRYSYSNSESLSPSYLSYELINVHVHIFVPLI
jgi:hypothetical protein